MTVILVGRRLAVSSDDTSNKTPPDKSGLSGAAARLGNRAVRPAQALIRGGAKRLEQAADDVLASPPVGRVVDSALAGPLPEDLARSVANHQVVERVAAELLDSIDVEAMVKAALEDGRLERAGRQLVQSPAFERIAADAVESLLRPELLKRVLESPEVQQALGEAASSPAVRAALTRQTRSLAEEMTDGLQRRTLVLDESSERTARRWLRRPPAAAVSPPGPAAFGGLPTRAVSLTIDLVLAHLSLVVLAGTIGLVSSLVGTLRPVWLVDVLAGLGWALIAGSYFIGFWTLVGQTPGMRLMHLRVERDGGPPGVARSIVRLFGLLLSIVPLFAGFLPVLFDDRRRGLADFLAGTVVRREDAAPEPSS